MEPNGAFKRTAKGFLAWLFKPRRRYGSYPTIERIVELLFKAVLMLWAFLFIRWVILITIATMRHFGVIGE